MVLVIADDLLFRSKISTAAKALGVVVGAATTVEAALPRGIRGNAPRNPRPARRRGTGTMTTGDVPSPLDVFRARQRLSRHLRPSPLIHCRWLSTVSNASVW